MWSLQRPQGISIIWPSDLVYDPKLPKFELIQSVIKDKHSDKFSSHLSKKCGLYSAHCCCWVFFFFLFFFLAHDLDMTPGKLKFKLSRGFIKTNLMKFKSIGHEKWPLERPQGISLI